MKDYHINIFLAKKMAVTSLIFLIWRIARLSEKLPKRLWHRRWLRNVLGWRRRKRRARSFRSQNTGLSFINWQPPHVNQAGLYLKDRGFLF